jgi:hypothetical protein
MSAWILIVVITLGNPQRIVMQEFETKQSCEQASGVIKGYASNTEVSCVPK